MTITPDTGAMLRFLTELLQIPSPTGFTEDAIAYVQRAFDTLELPGYRSALTRKGALVGTWEGQMSDAPRGVTAHVDTLGAMVREIKGNGRLMLTQLGGYMWNAIENESVTVYCVDSGVRYRGSVQTVTPSTHTSPDARTGARDEFRMEVRLDARTTSKQETRDLGIDVGDFVFFDPRVEVVDSGFIRSRHLDDKAGVAVIYGALLAMKTAGLTPVQRTTLHISNYEEVGHGGAAGFPADLAELLTIDMAASSAPYNNSDEFSVGICVKDSGGPYHVDMRRKLVRLAKSHEIPYKLDTYAHYGSDGEALWRAGADVRVGLIGPGVEGSHAYERTHQDSLNATASLIAAYLLDPA